MNNDGPTCSFAICWLDKCCAFSRLRARQMNRVNMIQFIMFLEDLARFALISGSSVRETLWSWREKKKNCLSSLNWEPHTQWKRHSSYVNLLHPKFIFQNQSVNILIGPSLYDCCAGSLSEDLQLNGVISSTDKMLKYVMLSNHPFI